MTKVPPAWSATGLSTVMRAGSATSRVTLPAAAISRAETVGTGQAKATRSWQISASTLASSWRG